MTYWIETITEAFEDAELRATDEQIKIVSAWVEGAHENYGLAFGHDAIANPLLAENTKLKNQLKQEQNKPTCRYCQGQGYIRSNGPSHYSESSCPKCKGEGRL